LCLDSSEPAGLDLHVIPPPKYMIAGSKYHLAFIQNSHNFVMIQKWKRKKNIKILLSKKNEIILVYFYKKINYNHELIYPLYFYEN
jgi:hypothetical protein